MPARVTQRKFDRTLGVPYPGLHRLDVDSAELLRLVKAGMLMKDAAKKFNIVRSTVCYRLKRTYPTEYKLLRKNPSPVRHFSDCVASHKAYKQVGSIRGAAKKLGISPNTVRGRLRFIKEILGDS